MNSIYIVLKNIRNQLPYFLLIAIYFFFVNLEARKENRENNKITNTKKNISIKNPKSVDKMTITIPVIPFKD
tara:strand:- start:24 stop:239 length:216 start_codon:yes stop_codon:yes gene_type:complete